jgi:hypothetical protein
MRFRVTKIPFSSVIASFFYMDIQTQIFLCSSPKKLMFSVGPLDLGFFFFDALGGKESGSTTRMSLVAIGC